MQVRSCPVRDSNPCFFVRGDGDQPSASRRTLCHGGRIPSSGWVGRGTGAAKRGARLMRRSATCAVGLAASCPTLRSGSPVPGWSVPRRATENQLTLTSVVLSRPMNPAGSGQHGGAPRSRPRPRHDGGRRAPANTREFLASSGLILGNKPLDFLSTRNRIPCPRTHCYMLPGAERFLSALVRA
jgi:hypothetical protein